MSDYYWDDLIDCLVNGTRSVVPVIGSELLEFPASASGSPVPFSQMLAEASASQLEEELRHRQVPIHVTDQARASLSEQRKLVRAAKVLAPGFQDHTTMVQAAQQALLATLPAEDLPVPLRLLAEMQSVFPLILSTTTDDLAARCLGLAGKDIRAASLGPCTDLDAGWQPGDAPSLFHLFGRIQDGSLPAFSLEDALEYLAHLHDKGRPLRLLSHLKKSEILFLGQRFPDYLALMFMRLIRGDRLGGEGTETLADGALPALNRAAPPDETSLVGFLTNYSTRTRIYHGGAASFITELHKRWQAAGKPGPADAADTGEVEPADMPRPAVFLSYASENRAEAEALAEALEKQHLPVWLDRWQLEGGDRFASKIERHIRRCRLFVPLLSRQSSARQRGWFRREWDLANLLLRDVGPDLTWVIPVTLDDHNAYDSPDLAEYFTVRGRSPHVLSCPGGELDPQDATHFIRKFQAAERAARKLT